MTAHQDEGWHLCPACKNWTFGPPHATCPRRECERYPALTAEPLVTDYKSGMVPPPQEET